MKEGVKPRKLDLEGLKASLASQPIEALVEIQATIAPLIENGKVAAAAKIKEQIAKLEEQARLIGIEA